MSKIKNSTKSANSEIKLVEVHGKKVTTTSLIVAELFGRSHGGVIKSLEKLKDRIHLDLMYYQDSYSREQKFYNLDERSFLIAMPFIGGNKAIEGQVKLVDEFLRIQKILNEPGRQEALKLKRDSHKLMMDVKEVVLIKEGYPITKGEFVKENLFVNRALTGKWAAIPEPEYGTYDAELMAKIRDFNTLLLVKYGKKQDARKQKLSNFVDEYRKNNPKMINQIKELHV